MISLTPAHRRAEEFAALVDAAAADAMQGADQETRHAELLELVGAMRGLPDPTPRADFVADLRERLMTEADVALGEVNQKLALPAHTRSPRDRRLALAAGTLALLGATSGVAVASQSALPGDTLYPIKRAIEGAQTTLTVDDSAKGNTMLDHASGRLDEIEALVQRHDADSEAEVPETLAEFSEQADKAADVLLSEYSDTGDSAPVARLREFTSTSMEVLGELNAVLPPSAGDALTKAALVLTEIDSRAAAACPACEGGITEIPAFVLALRASVEEQLDVAPRDVVRKNNGDSPPADDGDKGEEQPTDAFTPDLPVVDPGDLVDPPDQQAPEDTGDKTDRRPGDRLREGGKRATDELKDVLIKGDEVLTGEDGLLDPLLDPLLGEGGLLNR